MSKSKEAWPINKNKVFVVVKFTHLLRQLKPSIFLKTYIWNKCTYAIDKLRFRCHQTCIPLNLQFNLHSFLHHFLYCWLALLVYSFTPLTPHYATTTTATSTIITTANTDTIYTIRSSITTTSSTSTTVTTTTTANNVVKNIFLHTII